MFPSFPITNNAAMNILVNSSFHTFSSVSLGQIPGSRIAGLRENLLDIVKFCPTGAPSPPMIRENVPSAQVILRCASVENLEI